MKTKKHIKFNVITLFLFSIFHFACKNEKGVAPDLGYNFYPTNIGHYIEYEVDSIVYNDFTNTIDTTSYLLKEIIESEFENAAEIPSFKIVRYKRQNENSDWILSDVWFGMKNKTEIVRAEENIRFVKMIFPVKNGSRWNGNKYNTLEPQNYEYKNKDMNFTINSTNFDSTVIVKQLENLNLIEQQEFKEVYARNIGLIYKEMIDVKTEINGTIKSGYRYYQKIKSYGKN